MELLPFFEWLEGLPTSIAIRESLWFGAIDQSFHLVFLMFLAGSILVVDLRLLGTGMRERPIKTVAQDAWPWFLIGFTGMLITGIPQVMSTPTKQYYSPFFWSKMQLLAVALIFTFTLRHWVTRAEDGRFGWVLPKLVGLVSIGLWTAIATYGRLIGLLS
jgi:hypothetical protein